MPETLTIVYLVYMFIALYLLGLLTLIFIQNRKEMFLVPLVKKKYSLSVLVPAYNEQDSLEGTVEAIRKSDYGNIVEIIIINDGSTDKTLEIARKLEKKYSNVVVFDKKNSGKADSMNQAIKIAKGELVAVVDADSYPDSHAISSMIGFFEDPKTGGVTTRIIVRNPDNFLRRMQAIEYKVIAFTRKLLGFLDSIYVTPGPLAIYRKTALIKVGGFDKKNMTEDIELAWSLLHHEYNIKMSYAAKSTTVAPDTLRKWIKQRIRWNIGGYQCMLKYRGMFFKRGMLGLFILPFFSISLFLGIFGLGIFIYRTLRHTFVSYLSAKYSIAAQTAVISLQDVNLNPSVLNFLGVVLFILSLIFIFFALKHVNEKTKEKESFFSVLFYSLIYILLRPIVLVWSFAKFLTGKYSWR